MKAPTKPNERSRTYARKYGVWLWQAAEAMGLTDFQLSKMMRHEFTAELEKEFRLAVDQVVFAREQRQRGSK